MSDATARLAAPILLAWCMAACDPPPSVQAVDNWLTGHRDGDVELMVANAVPGDRALLRLAMAETTATSTLATLLPHPPIRHELMEIEKKEPGRHVVLCKVTTKNPLPFMSKRVGQDLQIPKTRTRLRRYLSVQGEDGRWGLKLDLPQVLERIKFVQAFQGRIRVGDFAGAEAMLAQVPAPPDSANVQRKKDRLPTTLQDALDNAREEAAATRTSTTSVPSP